MQYSISDLEQLSGISVHNIRIWERRYGALQPSRSAGNTRFYDEDQLKRLLCITGLYRSGHKISKACGLSSAEMSELLQQQENQTLGTEQRYEYVISQIVSNSLTYNEQNINTLITKSFEKDGILNTYKFIIYPLLTRIGLMWLNGKVCSSQEHFISQIIRQKLFSAIDNCRVKPTNDNKSWLLFLPEEEDHDIPLLLSNYLLRAAGERVIYLGPRVPLNTLGNAVAAVQPQQMLLFMTRVGPIADAQLYIDSLATEYSGIQIYLSGNSRVVTALKLPHNVTLLTKPDDFDQVITNLHAA